MSAPDARQLAERLVAWAEKYKDTPWNSLMLVTIAAKDMDPLTALQAGVNSARALLSALDALEQRGGGQADSGSTAAPCSVVEALRAERDLFVETLRWIQEFAAKSCDLHGGFVWVERRARSALANADSTTRSTLRAFGDKRPVDPAGAAKSGVATRAESCAILTEPSEHEALREELRQRRECLVAARDDLARICKASVEDGGIWIRAVAEARIPFVDAAIENTDAVLLQDPAKQGLPKSSDPSVEALEAERDRLQELLEQAEVDTERKVDAELRGRLVAAGAGRDQAIKENDEAREALEEALSTEAEIRWNASGEREVLRIECERRAAAEAGWNRAIKERVRYERALREIVHREAISHYSSIYACPGEFAEIARAALAGVPGGGHGSGQDIGGTAGAVPGSGNPKGES